MTGIVEAYLPSISLHLLLIVTLYHSLGKNHPKFIIQKKVIVPQSDFKKETNNASKYFIINLHHKTFYTKVKQNPNLT